DASPAVVFPAASGQYPPNGSHSIPLQSTDRGSIPRGPALGAGRVHAHHSIGLPRAPSSLNSDQRRVGWNAFTYGAHGRDDEARCGRNYADGDSLGNLLNATVRKPVHAGFRPDPDGAAGVLGDVVALGARKSVVAEEEQMRPVEAREFVSRQPQTATGILKQRLHILRGAGYRQKGVLLAECLRAGARQPPPNEDAHRAAREPVHFNIGIQPLSA